MSFPKSFARVTDLRMSSILDLPWPLMLTRLAKIFETPKLQVANLRISMHTYVL